MFLVISYKQHSSDAPVIVHANTMREVLHKAGEVIHAGLLHEAVVLIFEITQGAEGITVTNAITLLP